MIFTLAGSAFCLKKCGLCLAVQAQNLEVVSRQLLALVSSRSSSAWTLATHVAEDLSMQDLALAVEAAVVVTAELGFFLLAKSNWTENNE